MSVSMLFVAGKGSNSVGTDILAETNTKGMCVAETSLVEAKIVTISVFA